MIERDLGWSQKLPILVSPVMMIWVILGKSQDDPTLCSIACKWWVVLVVYRAFHSPAVMGSNKLVCLP